MFGFRAIILLSPSCRLQSGEQILWLSLRFLFCLADCCWIIEFIWLISLLKCKRLLSLEYCYTLRCVRPVSLTSSYSGLCKTTEISSLLFFHPGNIWTVLFEQVIFNLGHYNKVLCRKFPCEWCLSWNWIGTGFDESAFYHCLELRLTRCTQEI